MIGIQANAFTEGISAATLSKDRKYMLSDKQDVTNAAILAVAKFVENFYGGEFEADFTDAAGIKVQVTVISATSSGDKAVLSKVARVLHDEGCGPGTSIHGWRCEHPDRYGPCNCVDELADAVLAVLDLPTRDEAAERRAYSRAMHEQAEGITHLQGQIDAAHEDLLDLENRRRREVHAASERGRVYSGLIARINSGINPSPYAQETPDAR